MAFKKSFPHKTDKSVYPKWKEIELTDKEEKKAEKECRKRNVKVMQQCLGDAEKIVDRKKLHESQKGMIDIAIALFDKRASHEVFHKEKLAKKKFDKKFND